MFPWTQRCNFHVLCAETTKKKNSSQLVFDSSQLVCHCNSTVHPSVEMFMSETMDLKLNSTKIRMNHC